MSDGKLSVNDLRAALHPDIWQVVYWAAHLCFLLNEHPEDAQEIADATKQLRQANKYLYRQRGQV